MEFDYGSLLNPRDNIYVCVCMIYLSWTVKCSIFYVFFTFYFFNYMMILISFAWKPDHVYPA